MFINLPIIIVEREGNDIAVYHSIEEAESEIEVIDVENNEYIGYDSSGHRLIFDVVKEKRPFLCGLLSLNAKKVKIDLAEDYNSYETSLKEALKNYLIFIYPNILDSNSSLSQLLELVIKESKKSHEP
ncbi:MAG: hypothetical protein CVU61_02730 [Deltaproteobacteria bacterium HGW-Deltaproteobacteria-19]|nr:MAG: hypothetical protein CVU61_02730 [Deltaproteobacteria bacterium HGW-Deltaproteobacteria-19]